MTAQFSAETEMPRNYHRSLAKVLAINSLPLVHGKRPFDPPRRTQGPHLVVLNPPDSEGITHASIEASEKIKELTIEVFNTPYAKIKAIDTFLPFPGRVAEAGSFLFHIESPGNHSFQA